MLIVIAVLCSLSDGVSLFSGGERESVKDPHDHSFPNDTQTHQTSCAWRPSNSKQLTSLDYPSTKAVSSKKMWTIC